MTGKKRANAEGSLYWRKDRKRYEARLTVGRKPDGTPIRRTVIGKTRAEALDRMEALRRNLNAGVDLPSDVTVEQFLTHWRTDVLPLSDVTQTTRDQYETMVRVHIVPVLGSIRLDRLAPAHVRRMLTTMREAGLSANTQRLARSVLQRALKTALADGLVVRNAAADTDGVKLAKTEGRTLTPEQARTLLRHVSGSEWEPLIAMLLTLGLRKGEALAVSWSDLDLDRTPATLTVRRSLKSDARGALYVEEPKTANSWRTIHMPAPLADLLRAHRAAQAAERLAFGEGWGGWWADLGLMLTTSVGTPINPSRTTAAVKRLASEADLGEWTPHELRHSAASLMISEGVPLKTVSETLGHSSIRMTADVYGHLLPPARDDAADAMGRALWQ